MELSLNDTGNLLNSTPIIMVVELKSSKFLDDPGTKAVCVYLKNGTPKGSSIIIKPGIVMTCFHVVSTEDAQILQNYEEGQELAPKLPIIPGVRIISSDP